MKTNAQATKNYEKEWKNVNTLIEKRLPKSALAEVKKIYETAKKDKNDVQVIKSLVVIVKLQSEIREENEQLSISEMEKEISASKEPAASILKSLLAEMYLSYFRSVRWRIYSRSETVQFSKNDIKTWSAGDFHQKITELFLQSIEKEKLLQSTSLEPYDAIIEKGNVRHLRPTLYDLLAHRALEYYTDDEIEIQKPAFAFEITQPSAFAPATEFVKAKFSASDTSSLKYKALLLYQKLISFHLQDARPDALIDVDLERLTYVKNKSTHPDKDNLYVEALQHIIQKYDKEPAADQAVYLLAEWYNEKGGQFKPHGDTTYRFYKVKARELAEKIITRKDSTEGKINAEVLMRQIRQKHFQVNVENVNVPDLPFRSLVKYKNITSLHFRLVRANETLKGHLENNPSGEKYWEALLSAKPERSWEQPLPDTKDHQEHAVEIKIDALPPGEYFLLACDEKSFTLNRNFLAAHFFYVSNLSFVNFGKDYFVLHRNTGRPISKATVHIWQKRYDYTQNKFLKEKIKTLTTDQNGHFRFELSSGRNNYYARYLFDIQTKDDRLFMNNEIHDFSSYSKPNMEEISTQIFFFTDRSLYRPGQTLYFKGIGIIKSGTDKSEIVSAGYTNTVLLKDANGQIVDKLKVTANEYGTFSGTFQLPKNALNGMFVINVEKDYGSATFRVEEYKRPKFYVDFEPLKGTYRLNDKIKVTGFAKAYAGNNIDKATVKFRVVREHRFIYPWLFSRWWQPPSEKMEIAHGEIQTDPSGKFVIEFQAIPDLKIDKKYDPVFYYRIYADVTDINSETRSGEKEIAVSYKSLLLKSSIPDALPADSFKKITVRTENLNGEFEPSVVKISVYKLKPEQRFIRERLWERPDQFIMTKEQYIQYFPYDEYDNESDKASWPKEKMVFEKSVALTEKENSITAEKTFEPGYYAIEITTQDKDKQEVKDVKFIELYNEKSTSITHPVYLVQRKKQTIAEPGQSAEIDLATGIENLFVIHKIIRREQKDNKENDFQFLNLSKQKMSFRFPVTENDRGGFGVTWMFVYHNRMFQLTETVMVPWSNKELQIEYITFREKTLPGSEEKWKVKISGLKKEKVAAELLAAMYDASLDQFYPHAWYKPELWPVYQAVQQWNKHQNFTSFPANLKYPESPESKYVLKIYDRLLESSFLWYSYENFYYKKMKVDVNDWTRMRGVMSMAQPEAESADEATVMANGNVAVRTKKEKKESDSTQNLTPEQKPGITAIRKNFNETAFFFPDLRTDTAGNIEFSFTMPEALTRWKFMALAHTKEAAFGLSIREVITQKDLMVQPNPPRFLREGDRLELSSKIVNLTDKEITGSAELQLLDAVTLLPVDGLFANRFPKQFFTVSAAGSEAVRFPVEIPYQFNKPVIWRIIAKAGSQSDGEENILSVLSNRMLVTETMPLPMRGAGTKEFRFEKLLQSKKSNTLQHHNLTVEYTANPAWLAVQSLPYLMEYPYECAEQIWNRYYANTLASHLVHSKPLIKEIFDRWKNSQPSAFLSALQKNQELKSIVLEETPWVLAATLEAEQKRNVALLFDLVKMSEELNSAFEKLKKMQSPNGGFVWFSGGPDDRYITQYIIGGIGHLKKLNAILKGQQEKLNSIVNSALPYLDRKMKEDYENLIKWKTDLNKYIPDFHMIHYLYVRSFFPEYNIAAQSKKAYEYFHQQAQKTWTKQSKYMQGMIALTLHRSGDKKTPRSILQSLKETSILHEELGRYWKDLAPGWYRYQAPIEAQALFIEAFSEIANDKITVDELKTWLLKNKQTNHWKTTIATAEACYALLLQGSDWISAEPSVTFELGKTIISSADEKANSEAGTGYFRKTIDPRQIQADMGSITVTVVPGNTKQKETLPSSWGAVYWQYFEDLDKITEASTPLKLSKKLFVEKNTDRGPVISPVKEGDKLKVGDKIKVRIELRVDRDMEYVHMKDMRAAGLEPVNVLSRYKWQGGLGYYESTKDASTNFFFSYLRKGTYVFEYPLFVTHKGNFSNGITSIQCMYAPEFTSHSEGVRIVVE
ncbi:MAG: MG2 domain-containing protein [Chitinophagaceae bacterium]|nr:MG2 domain-containing protein [Chitinophagaceae bacterium]